MCRRQHGCASTTWTRAGRVGPVTDEQAREWLDANALMRAVVVKPWVLVQPRLVNPAGHA